MTSRTLRLLPALSALTLMTIQGTACSREGGGSAGAEGAKNGPAVEATAAARTTSSPKDVPGLEGTTAADFTLTALDGKTVKLSDHKGKVVIVDFWATWCPPCRRELPHFVDLHREWASSKKVEILGIALDRQGKAVVGPFVEAAKIPYPILIGTPDVVASYGNFNGIPTTFVIDREGKIYRRYAGYRAKEIFEADIKTLIGKKSPSS